MPRADSAPARHRSHGDEHAAKVRLGMLQSTVRHATGISSKLQDERIDLARNIFGQSMSHVASSGQRTSQNLALFVSQEGSLDAFDYNSQTHQQLARQRILGIYSHVTAQKQALLSKLKSSQPKHVVVAVV